MNKRVIQHLDIGYGCGLDVLVDEDVKGWWGIQIEVNGETNGYAVAGFDSAGPKELYALRAALDEVFRLTTEAEDRTQTAHTEGTLPSNGGKVRGS